MKYQHLQFTLPGMPFKWISERKAVWENGTTFELLGHGRGRIVSGGIGYPVKFSGDAYHSLRMGFPLPEICKEW
jgi:hypothetical protein